MTYILLVPLWKNLDQSLPDDDSGKHLLTMLPSLRLDNPHLNDILYSLPGVHSLVKQNKNGVFDNDIQQEVGRVVELMDGAIRNFNNQCLLLRRLEPPEDYPPEGRDKFLAWKKSSIESFGKNGEIRNDMIEVIKVVTELADEAGVNAKALKEMIGKMKAKQFKEEGR